MLNLLNSKYMVLFINEDGKNLIIETVNKMEGNEVKDEDFELIIESLNILIRSSILNEPTTVFRQFLDAFIELITEWDEQEKFKELTDYLVRIIDKTLTINESCVILKQLNNILNSTAKWKPQSFELSEHYLNLIEG